MQLDRVLEQIDAELPAAQQRLFELLRISSVSTDPSFKQDVANAAAWCSAELSSLGFAAQVIQTEGHPMVVAHYEKPNTQTLLFYGHYDVQPVDPLALWASDPFEPTVIDTPHGPAIRARGASDDKGQLMTFIEACRSILAVEGGLPCSVTVFLEGEEESGSPSMVPFLKSYGHLLQADLGLICDTGMMDRQTPSIVTMLRGMVQDEVIIRGPNKDLHSGMFGGPAINPIRVLSRALAALHDEQGHVTLEGFYDGVPVLPESILEQWNGLDFDASEFLGAVGLSEPAGEQDRSVLEQLWARPTCEVNGISGGYTGQGFKTVLPAEARAKVSFRLVGEQDPQKVRAAFYAHIKRHLPADCEAEFIAYGGDHASVMPTTSAQFAAIQQALTDEWEREAVFVGCGGSIPIAGLLQKMLGINTALVGFAQDDDAIHSPNEKYDVASFRKGIRSWARILCGIV
ncbi:MAG: M20/M25/M40 family metallo-hydrolase [Gammaproteobacteria bacterium]|nr:M20/M25/M40 family metallo-hydrolase [Gammaproteobacteria bacterium]